MSELIPNLRELDVQKPESPGGSANGLGLCGYGHLKWTWEAEEKLSLKELQRALLTQKTAGIRA